MKRQRPAFIGNGRSLSIVNAAVNDDFRGALFLCRAVAHARTLWQSPAMKKSETKRKFTATVSREGRWYVAQCLEVDVAGQGRTEKSALKNLADALKLHFTPPVATATPKIRSIQISRAA